MNSFIFSFGAITIMVLPVAKSYDGKLVVLPYADYPHEVEELYLRIRNRETGRRSGVPATQFDAKQRICKDIASSAYFEKIGRQHVKINDVRHELETTRNYRYFNIIKDLNENLIYTNPTKEILVYINEHARTIADYAFVCLARNILNCKIEEYYISEPYNVNKATQIYTYYPYIAGHFIFVKHRTELTWVFHSFAEESAKTTLTNLDYNLENFYIRIREVYKLEAKTREEDPLCRISDFDKMRVCASVLTRPDFFDEFEFVPDTSNISSVCTKRTILFRTERAKNAEDIARSEGIAFPDEEWMFRCIGQHPRGSTGEKREYFISRAYNSNKVFVYSRNNDKVGIHLVKHSAFVSAVVDE